MVVVLPAPFGPREANDLAGVHREGDVVDSYGFAAVGFAELSDGKDTSHAAPIIARLWHVTTTAAVTDNTG